MRDLEYDNTKFPGHPKSCILKPLIVLRRFEILITSNYDYILDVKNFL
jgi:hypothetical protein